MDNNKLQSIRSFLEKWHKEGASKYLRRIYDIDQSPIVQGEWLIKLEQSYIVNIPQLQDSNQLVITGKHNTFAVSDPNLNIQGDIYQLELITKGMDVHLNASLQLHIDKLTNETTSGFIDG